MLSVIWEHGNLDFKVCNYLSEVSQLVPLPAMHTKVRQHCMSLHKQAQARENWREKIPLSCLDGESNIIMVAIFT